ncbi:HPr family phosphocarrier protein [Desulfobacterales bacterium HSG16]|nr:HPr family phosphocarrier protein [Desulfobacterales bacterium HSG16]
MQLKNNVCDFSFAEKTRLFSHSYLIYCSYISGLGDSSIVLAKRLYSRLIAESQVLEDFLDFHGAKNSKKWFFYRELSAAVRHLSLGGYSQKHISNRLVFYCLTDTEEFERQGKLTLQFLTECLMNLGPVILQEARCLEIPIPDGSFSLTDFPSIATSEILEDAIDDVAKEQQKKKIVRIASEFLNIVKHFEQFAFYEPYDIEEILTIVPDRINEVEIRRFEMKVHNLQSYFDTHMMHGGINAEGSRLKQFRSYFSIVFHLLQLIGRLLHFYERHLHEAGYKNIYKNAQNNLSELIDPHQLLDRTINYGLYYVCHFLTTGRDLAKKILNENIERSSVKVGIPVERGFHCRPSLLVAKIVQHYGGQVELCAGASRFDAGSVLDIQWAGGKIKNEDITEVVFEGDDRALKDIKVLANVNYGEDAMGRGIPLPKELKYLRD